ncbi:hypothetical protein EXIGLDRAFT_638565 [Exidia glandulosa HHB12029]|uniref:Efficient mitochondria targeting-associated protein 19 n=1 Tax=Exidia glandulosa HHB12029 TaxID=1314781 RepID=A0A165NUK3_EXIGL|nr:hypothetical protein EXIGLDRAFT_638565 [Exidia glandulosa HHB12029]
MTSAPSLLSRPLDLLYFAFFIVHIPISLLVDFQQLYPRQWVPSAVTALADWYLSEHGDPIYAGGMGLLKSRPHDVVWLQSFTVLEMIFQFPVFFVGAWALYNGRKAWYPLLLAYGASTATTLVACVSYLAAYPTASKKSATFETMTVEQKLHVIAMMSPWIVIPALLTVDMALRIAKELRRADRLVSSRKTQ